MPTKFLGVEEVAALFPGQTPGSLYAQRTRGLNPGALGVKVGRRILWRESDLDVWYEQQRAEQLQEAAR